MAKPLLPIGSGKKKVERIDLVFPAFRIWEELRKNQLESWMRCRRRRQRGQETQ
jgi:hypothetical protein